MSECLIITDLNYSECLQIADLAITGIVGGYVSTTANTSAGSDSANAIAGAFAQGQQTYTNTRALTITQRYSSSFSSYANASATAFAQNSFREKSSYRSTSIYYSGY